MAAFRRCIQASRHPGIRASGHPGTQAPRHPSTQAPKHPSITHKARNTGCRVQALSKHQTPRAACTKRAAFIPMRSTRGSPRPQPSTEVRSASACSTETCCAIGSSIHLTLLTSVSPQLDGACPQATEALSSGCRMRPIFLVHQSMHQASVGVPGDK